MATEQTISDAEKFYLAAAKIGFFDQDDHVWCECGEIWDVLNYHPLALRVLLNALNSHRKRCKKVSY